MARFMRVSRVEKCTPDSTLGSFENGVSLGVQQVTANICTSFPRNRVEYTKKISAKKPGGEP